MNILAIGAHPDDVETMCAGTLAKYASQGHKVFIATATSGNIGSATHTMEEIAAISSPAILIRSSSMGASGWKTTGFPRYIVFSFGARYMGTKLTAFPVRL